MKAKLIKHRKDSFSSGMHSEREIGVGINKNLVPLVSSIGNLS
jgi:hypothetical protein